MAVTAGSAAGYAAHKAMLAACYTSEATARLYIAGIGDSNHGRTSSGQLWGRVLHAHGLGIKRWSAGIWGPMVNNGDNYSYMGGDAKPASYIDNGAGTLPLDDLIAQGSYPTSYDSYAIPYATMKLNGMAFLQGVGAGTANATNTQSADGYAVMKDGDYFDEDEAVEQSAWFCQASAGGGVTMLLREVNENTLAFFSNNATGGGPTVVAAGPGVVRHTLSVDAAGRSAGGFRTYTYRKGSPQETAYWNMAQAIQMRDWDGVANGTFWYGGGLGTVNLNYTLFTVLNDNFVDAFLQMHADLVGADGFVLVPICLGVNDVNDTEANETGAVTHADHESFDPTGNGSRVSGVFSNTADGWENNTRSVLNYLRTRWDATVTNGATLLFQIVRSHRNTGATESALAGYGDRGAVIAESRTDTIYVDETFTEAEMSSLSLWNTSGSDKDHLEESDTSSSGAYAVHESARMDAYISEVQVYTSGGFRTRTRGFGRAR